MDQRPPEHRPAPPPPRHQMSPDTRWIIATGLGVATLILTLIGVILQQNAGIHARIDDTNRQMNERFNDVNERFNDINGRFDDTNRRFDDTNRRFDDTNERFNDLNRRIDAEQNHIRAEMREIRSLLLQLIERTPPAD